MSAICHRRSMLPVLQDIVTPVEVSVFVAGSADKATSKCYSDSDLCNDDRRSASGQPWAARCGELC